MGKITKTQFFEEAAVVLNGLPEELVAKICDISVKTLRIHIRTMGVNCLHIEDGVLVVDKEWNEIRDIESNLRTDTWHLIDKNLRLAKSSFSTIRRNKEDVDWTDPYRVNDKERNPGKKEAPLHLRQTLQKLKQSSHQDSLDVLSEINKKGNIGGERLG